MRIVFLSLAWIAMCAFPSSAQDSGDSPSFGLINQANLSFDGAMAIYEAFEQVAALEGQRATIVVLDRGGFELLVARQKNEDHTTVMFARSKAETALAIGQPTLAIHERLSAGDQTILSVSGMMAIPGGIPIKHNGEVVGAIGVSGTPALTDHKIAIFAASALSTEIQSIKPNAPTNQR